MGSDMCKTSELVEELLSSLHCCLLCCVVCSYCVEKSHLVLEM